LGAARPRWGSIADRHALATGAKGPLSRRLLSRPWLMTLARLTSLGCLLIYGALTVAYLAPPNSLTAPLQPVLRATIGTYFEQSWSLFAPIPVSSDLALLARPMSRGEVAALPASGWPGDGWHDLSTPLWARATHNPFAADGRLRNAQVRAITAYLGRPAELDAWWIACQSGDTVACAHYTAQLQLARAEAERLLVKIASASIQHSAQAGQDISHVALRVRVIPGAPWSQRYEAGRDVFEIDVGVYPVDFGVSPPALGSFGEFR
jgi:hypothetical protein